MMGKIWTIIIEDEKPAQEILKSYISRTDWLTLSGVFEDALTAMDYLKSHDVDLIFLDIQIPSLSGIEFLKLLNPAPQTIITTAYSEYALDAFELDVRDYLKKPFSFERFLKAVNRISPKPDPGQIHSFQPNGVIDESFAFFNVNKTMVRVLFNDILYVESMREYIYVYTPKGRIITKMSTSLIEKMLGPNFLRVHRSFIVNAKKVTAFNAEDIFIDQATIPIGPSYKKQVDDAFKKHLLT